MAKYVDSKIWLRITGGVEGWDLDDLNRYIDRWNGPDMKCVRSWGNFWEWLSYERGYEIHGFSALWWSELCSRIHTIKR